MRIISSELQIDIECDDPERTWSRIVSEIGPEKIAVTILHIIGKYRPYINKSIGPYADDVVQEAAIRATSHFHKFKPWKGTLTGWVYRIVTNEVKRMLSREVYDNRAEAEIKFIAATDDDTVIDEDKIWAIEQVAIKWAITMNGTRIRFAEYIMDVLNGNKPWVGPTSKIAVDEVGISVAMLHKYFTEFKQEVLDVYRQIA